jgi:RNA polymerase sigma factor (sigma-70 family)
VFALSMLRSPKPDLSPPALAGSAQARELLTLVRAVVARIMSRAPSHPDVEDAVQETLRRVVEGQDRVAPDERRPWAVGVARHVALDALRAQRRRNGARGESVKEPVDPAPTPFERLAASHDRLAAHQALAKLPDEMAKVLVLFHVEGLSYQTIATQLSLPVGTVATWIVRGRKMLAESAKRSDR